ncbi:carbohydrate-binding module family 50 protein, partial [Plenodomus tracheiphilus IPT5]
AVFEGFQIVEPGSLEGLGLGTTCEDVLYRTLKCDNYTARFSTPKYRAGLKDKALTASVCDASCSDALAVLSKRVKAACTAKKEIYPGYPTAALIDTIWGGWNETCLMDANKAQYYIIESWAEVEELTDMPKANLCSYCYTKKLATMQANIYGVYARWGYQETYDYVVKTCALPAGTPTQGIDGFTIPAPSAPSCEAGRSYTAVNGDTCDSIAKSKLVSSTSFYALNPMLLDCSKIPAGTKLCLPLSCEKLYQVKQGDSCPEVAVENRISWQDIVLWNDLIDPYCSNIDQTNPNFGKTICISPPGGSFVTPPANETGGGIGGPGGTGDGYSENLAVLPPGAVLAARTTTKCGEYYTVKTGDTCQAILVAANTPADLFIAVNPSLRDIEGCTQRLAVGRTYCIHPNSNWN